MAVVKDQVMLFQERISHNKQIIAQLQETAGSSGSSQISALREINHQYEIKLQHEKMKLEDQHIENARRRHNFVPLAVTLLQELAIRDISWLDKINER